MTETTKEGNKFLFTLIRILNILFGIGGLGLIGLGIWLWKNLNSFTIIQIVIIGLGIFQCLLVLFAWTAKKSTVRLRIYLMIFTVLFLMKLTVIIIIFKLGPDIIKKIEKNDQEIDLLKKDMFAVNYYCIAVMSLMLIQIILVACYINSVRNANLQFDYKLMDEDGNKITLQEKSRRDYENIAAKYDAKRQEMHQKYSNYQKYKENQNNDSQIQ